MAAAFTFNRSDHWSPDDFLNPDKVVDYLVNQLDRMVDRLGVKPVILSDWRPVDPQNPDSQHSVGRAVDVAFPGQNSLSIYNQLREARLFRGIGVYTNESGAESFHLDVRTDRTTADPALWGAFIQPVIVGGQTVRQRTYTTVNEVLKVVKARGIPILGIVALAALVLYLKQKR